MVRVLYRHVSFVFSPPGHILTLLGSNKFHPLPGKKFFENGKRSKNINEKETS